MKIMFSGPFKKVNSKLILRFFVGAIFVVVCGFFGFNSVYAAQCGGVDTSIITCKEGGDGGIWHIIHLVVDILSIGVGIAGVIGISIAGVEYLTAGPNVEKTKKAKERIYQVVIGLAAYVMMFVGMQWLMPNGIINQDIVAVSGVSVKSVNGAIEVGKSQKLQVSFEPENVTDRTVTWRSSDPSIATVSLNGVVVGRKAGKVTITAIASDGQSADVEVEIAPSSEASSGGTSGSSGTSGNSTMSGKTNAEIRNELSATAKYYAKTKNRKEYQQAVRETGVANGGGTGGPCRRIGKSCSAFVATVVRSVITDSTGKKWPASTASIPKYVARVNAKHPGTWKVILASAKKEPGDIIYEYNGSFGASGHTAIFINNGGKTVIAEAAVDENYPKTGRCDGGSWPHITNYTRAPLYHDHVIVYRYMGGAK